MLPAHSVSADSPASAFLHLTFYNGLDILINPAHVGQYRDAGDGRSVEVVHSARPSLVFVVLGSPQKIADAAKTVMADAYNKGTRAEEAGGLETTSPTIKLRPYDFLKEEMHAARPFNPAQIFAFLASPRMAKRSPPTQVYSSDALTGGYVRESFAAIADRLVQAGVPILKVSSLRHG